MYFILYKNTGMILYFMPLAAGGIGNEKSAEAGNIIFYRKSASGA